MKIKPFILYTRGNNKIIKLVVEQIELNSSFERFKLNSESGRSIIIQSDRPFARSTGKRKKIKWQVYQGEYNNVEALTWTIMLLEKEVLKMETAAGEIEVKPKVVTRSLF